MRCFVFDSEKDIFLNRLLIVWQINYCYRKEGSGGGMTAKNK